MSQNLMFVDSQPPEEVRMIGHVMNLEAVTTYERTYDVDGLILGLAITVYRECC